VYGSQNGTAKSGVPSEGAPAEQAAITSAQHMDQRRIISA
jgi:hypothetical protein